jgi:hypothetical protein
MCRCARAAMARLEYRTAATELAVISIRATSDGELVEFAESGRK